MAKSNVAIPVEQVASLMASRLSSAGVKMHLVYINGSKMVGFRITEATNAASAVHLNLTTDTGSVPLSLSLTWGTYVEIEITS